MKKKSKISVIMPYYKKRDYIKQTIKSVLNQTYQNFEIILVYDDQDLSDLHYIKKNFKTKKLKIIVNKKNLGAGYSRNVAIKHSSGEYISFLDSDDYWKKKKLFYQLNFMKKNSYQITHTDYTVLSKNKTQKRIAKEISFTELMRSCDIGLSTVMIKKRLLNKKSFANLKTKEDYVLWLKILKNGIKIYPLNKNLTIWQETQNSLSSSVYQKIKDGYSVYRHYLKQNSLQSAISLLTLSFNYLKKNIFNE